MLAFITLIISRKGPFVDVRQLWRWIASNGLKMDKKIFSWINYFILICNIFFKHIQTCLSNCLHHSNLHWLYLSIKRVPRYFIGNSENISRLIEIMTWLPFGDLKWRDFAISNSYLLSFLKNNYCSCKEYSWLFGERVKLQGFW